MSSGSVNLPRRLFPLHLHVLERFMWMDDQPRYPMAFVIRLGLLGVVNHAAFETALAEALQRHPLLACVIAAGKRGQPSWVPADRPPVLDWADDSQPVTCPQGERIDLCREPGLRVWLRQGPQRAQVLLQFHHACCDGTGAYRFIGDLLACYGRHTAANDADRPTLADIDAGLLRHRGRRALFLGLDPGRNLALPAARFGLGLVLPPVQRLAPPAGTIVGAPFPGFLTESLDRAETDAVRAAVRRLGGSINDLLLRDLMLTLRECQYRHGAGGRSRRLCIMVPADLRLAEDCAMPAAMLTSFAFLSCRQRACDDPQSLRQRIGAAMGRVRYGRSGSAFADMVCAFLRVRPLLPFLLSRNICLATAVLSNAADPSRRFTARFARRDGLLVCGDVVLDEITGVPPLRHNTRATFSISQYGRCMAISLKCDPWLFGTAETATLLGMYTAQLRSTAVRY